MVQPKFYFTLALVFLSVYAAAADKDLTFYENGTQGRYAGDRLSMHVPSGTRDTLICDEEALALAADAGLISGDNCLRFSSEYAGESGASLGLVLAPGGSFNSFVVAFQKRPDRDVCEIIEDPWSGWQNVGEVPTTCGGPHDYTQENVCTEPANACSDTCPGTGSEHIDTRTTTVTNERCNTAPVLTINAGAIGGETATQIGSFYATQDAEIDRVEVYWQFSGACNSSYNNRWVESPRLPTVTRSSAGTCKITGTPRDAQGLLGNAVTATGIISSSCDENAWTAPDGGTIDAYAETCAAPNTFEATNACGGASEIPCNADMVCRSDLSNYAAVSGDGLCWNLFGGNCAQTEILTVWNGSLIARNTTSIFYFATAEQLRASGLDPSFFGGGYRGETNDGINFYNLGQPWGGSSRPPTPAQNAGSFSKTWSFYALCN